MAFYKQNHEDRELRKYWNQMRKAFLVIAILNAFALLHFKISFS